MPPSADDAATNVAVNDGIPPTDAAAEVSKPLAEPTAEDDITQNVVPPLPREDEEEGKVRIIMSPDELRGFQRYTVSCLKPKFLQDLNFYFARSTQDSGNMSRDSFGSGRLSETTSSGGIHHYRL